MTPSCSSPEAVHGDSIPPFEPITDLSDYALVFAQKGYDSAGPALWVSEQANPYMAAAALRLAARQVEKAADAAGYPDSDRLKAQRYAPAVFQGRHE